MFSEKTPDTQMHRHTTDAWWQFGIVVTRCSRSTRLTYAEPVSTGMGDCVQVRPPGTVLYFGL